MISGLLAYILGSIQVFIESVGSRFTTLADFLEQHFGQAGHWMLWALVVGLVLLLCARASRLMFNLFRYVLIPSAILSIIGLMLLPGWSPMKSFPVFASVATVLMVARTR